MRSVYFPLFWRATGLTNLTLTGINVFLSFVRYFHNGVQCLFPIVLSGAQDFARFPKTSCDFESALLFLKKLKTVVKFFFHIQLNFINSSVYVLNLL